MPGTNGLPFATDPETARRILADARSRGMAPHQYLRFIANQAEAEPEHARRLTTEEKIMYGAVLTLAETSGPPKVLKMKLIDFSQKPHTVLNQMDHRDSTVVTLRHDCDLLRLTAHDLLVRGGAVNRLAATVRMWDGDGHELATRLRHDETVADDVSAVSWRNLRNNWARVIVRVAQMQEVWETKVSADWSLGSPLF